MKRIVYILLISICIFSCEKDKSTTTCSGECLGTQTALLNNSNYYIDKDTTFKFISSTNDTISLISRTTYTTIVNITGNCQCTNMNTNINSENLFRTYVFKKKNFAFQLHVSTNYLLKVVCGFVFADTNDVIHQVHNSSDTTGSSYLIQDFNGKQNDINSMSLNGKNYNNIFNTFDQTYYTTYSQITNIYYSKGFGIIRFTYNNVVYTII